MKELLFLCIRQRRGRLVKDHHIRAKGFGAGDLDHLLHRDRERTDPHIRTKAASQRLECRRGIATQFTFFQHTEAVGGPGPKIDVLGNRQFR